MCVTLQTEFVIIQDSVLKKHHLTLAIHYHYLSPLKKVEFILCEVHTQV